jgi:DNA-directed RNA polymerase specialized sigma24 family protein
VDPKSPVFQTAARVCRSLLPAPTSDLQDWQFARAAYPPPAGLGSPDTEVLDKLPDPRLQRAFHQLPGHFRTAVYLADIEGYGMKEIADIMGTPVGTVTSRVHRGRRQLRALLPPPAGPPDRTDLSHPDGTDQVQRAEELGP